MSARPLPTPSGNSHSAAQSLGLGQNGEGTNVGSGGMLWNQPLAPYGWDMSWRERRHWRKLEKEQEKLRRDWERDELKRAKAAHKEIERKEKEGIKKKKQEIKWVRGQWAKPTVSAVSPRSNAEWWHVGRKRSCLKHTGRTHIAVCRTPPRQQAPPPQRRRQGPSRRPRHKPSRQSG